MENSKPSPTSMDGNSKLQRSDPTNIPDSALPYQNLIGSLMYLSVLTRPDIKYAVSAPSRLPFNQIPFLQVALLISPFLSSY